METVDHLILGCVVARALWAAMLLPIGLGSLVPDCDESIVVWWLRQRARIDSAALPMFDSIFLLTTWTIWKERNDVTFGRGPVKSTRELFQALGGG